MQRRHPSSGQRQHTACLRAVCAAQSGPGGVSGAAIVHDRAGRPRRWVLGGGCLAGLSQQIGGGAAEQGHKQLLHEHGLVLPADVVRKPLFQYARGFAQRQQVGVGTLL